MTVVVTSVLVGIRENIYHVTSVHVSTFLTYTWLYLKTDFFDFYYTEIWYITGKQFILFCVYSYFIWSGRQVKEVCGVSSGQRTDAKETQWHRRVFRGRDWWGRNGIVRERKGVDRNTRRCNVSWRGSWQRLNRKCMMSCLRGWILMKKKRIRIVWRGRGIELGTMCSSRSGWLRTGTEKH